MATTPNFGWPTPDDTDLVRDGAAAIRALGDAIDASVGQGFVYAGTRYYTSSGDFEKADPLQTGDIGLRAIRVRVQAAGGGGGGAASGSGMGLAGCGGGGSYAESFISDIAGLVSSVTVTVGAGGTAGAAGNNNGSAGGASSFGSLVTSFGGNGGFGSANVTSVPSRGAANGAGGAVGVGDIVRRGEGTDFAGSTRWTTTQTGLILTANSLLGTCGTPNLNSATIVAAAVGGIGAGGGPGVTTAAAGINTPGGTGGVGIVIVDCFV